MQNKNLPPFQVKGINHIGLASKDSQKTKAFFELLHLPFIGNELVLEQKTNTIIFDAAASANATEGVSKLEILEPVGEDSPVGKYLAKTGGGIHHIALTVDNLEQAIHFLLENQIKMVDTAPRNGVCNTKIAFVHPASTGGILVELVQNL